MLRGGRALHVVESSSDPNVAEEVRRLREVAGLALILAAYGEPSRIVGAGLAVGAVDVLILPQPTETLLFAPQGRDARWRQGRQGRDRVLAEGRERQDRAGNEPRRGGRARSNRKTLPLSTSTCSSATRR